MNLYNLARRSSTGSYRADRTPARTFRTGICRPVRSLLFFIVLLYLLPDPGQASGNDSILPPDTSNLVDFTFFPEFDPFESDEPLHISLEFNMKDFIRQKNKGEYHNAIIRFTPDKGETVERMIRIRARGEFRREHCTFPPVKLNFKKSGMSAEYMNDITTLKLVTHCKGSQEYQQYILKEFLVYRMFNLLTEYSYRVRLFEIEYIDSEKKMKSISKYGFIIESNRHFAARTNSVHIDREGIATWLTYADHTNLLTLFQYMIGNTDWAIPKLHNIRLFKPADPTFTAPVAIPYDFDYCGMVNAYYAIPDERLGIESVRVRVYRGYCLDSEEDYLASNRIILDQREEIYSLVRNCAFLNNKHRKDMLIYLDEFFQILDDPKRMRISIIDRCREIPTR
jgi:hypothetical protein